MFFTKGTINEHDNDLIFLIVCAAWHQHDVQELCRVMFDALETKFKKTENEDLINRLYQGQMKDYVKCLEVIHEC